MCRLQFFWCHITPFSQKKTKAKKISGDVTCKYLQELGRE